MELHSDGNNGLIGSKYVVTFFDAQLILYVNITYDDLRRSYYYSSHEFIYCTGITTPRVLRTEKVRLW